MRLKELKREVESIHPELSTQHRGCELDVVSGSDSPAPAGHEEGPCRMPDTKKLWRPV